MKNQLHKKLKIEILEDRLPPAAHALIPQAEEIILTREKPVQQRQGNINDTNREFTYQVTLKQGDLISVSAEGERYGRLDTLLRIFDDKLNEVSFNDNANPGQTDSVINFVPNNDGLFYIGVSDSRNRNYNPLIKDSGLPGYSFGFFNLLLRNETSTSQNYKITDNINHSTDLDPIQTPLLETALDDPASGGTSVDARFYRFSLRTGEGLIVNQEMFQKNPNLGIRFFDVLGNEFAPGHQDGIWKFYPPKEGTYYLGLSFKENSVFDPTNRTYFEPASNPTRFSLKFETFHLETDRSIFNDFKTVNLDPIGEFSEEVSFPDFHSVISYRLEIQENSKLVVNYQSEKIVGVIRVFDNQGNQINYSSQSAATSDQLSLIFKDKRQIFICISSGENKFYNPLMFGISNGTSRGLFSINFKCESFIEHLDSKSDSISTATLLENSLDIIKSNIENYKNDYIYSNFNGVVQKNQPVFFKFNIYNTGYLLFDIAAVSQARGALSYTILSNSGGVLAQGKETSLPLVQKFTPGTYYLKIIGDNTKTNPNSLLFNFHFHFENFVTINDLTNLKSFKFLDYNNDSIPDVLISTPDGCFLYQGIESGLLFKIQEIQAPTGLRNVQITSFDSGKSYHLVLTGAHDVYFQTSQANRVFTKNIRLSDNLKIDPKLLFFIDAPLEDFYFTLIPAQGNAVFLLKYTQGTLVNFSSKPIDFYWEFLQQESDTSSLPKDLFLYDPTELAIKKVSFVTIGIPGISVDTIFQDPDLRGDLFKVADINNDQKPDLVLGNSTNKTIKIFCQKPSGGFTKKDLISLSTNFIGFKFIKNNTFNELFVQKTNSIVTFIPGDNSTYRVNQVINLVSDLDSLVLQSTPTEPGSGLTFIDKFVGMIQTYLPGGNGRFIIPDKNLTDLFSGNFVSGDLNNDGFLDLVFSNPVTKQLSINLGFGNGTFSLPTFIQLSILPDFLNIMDFNQDGVLDLLVASKTEDRILLFLGRGDSTYVRPKEISIGQNIQLIKVLDLNNDKLSDIVYLDQKQNIYQMLSLGDGNFIQPQIFSINKKDPVFKNKRIVEFSISDLNKDKLSDISILLSPINLLSIQSTYLLNFIQTKPVNSNTLSFALDKVILLNDFNFLDTDQILNWRTSFSSGYGISFIISQNGNAIQYSYNQNQDELTKTILPVKNIVSFKSIDYNSDKLKDLIVLQRINGLGKISIFVARPNGQFSIVQNTDIGSFNSFDLIIGDFNNDSIDDIVVNNPLSNHFTLLPGENSAFFINDFSRSIGNRAIGITSSDFNGDGNPDLAVAIASLDITGSAVGISLGDGLGGFGQTINVPVDRFAFTISYGDFNGDGLSDIVNVNRDGNSVSIVPGDRKNQFVRSITLPLGGKDQEFLEPASLFVTDVNNDSLPDILVGNYRDNSFTILLNLGDYHFQEMEPISSMGDEPLAIASGDLNGDGLKDVVVANHGSGNLSVFFQEPGLTFKLHQIIVAGFSPTELALADGQYLSNGQYKGDPFLAITNQKSGSVIVYKWDKAGTLYQFQSLGFPGTASLTLGDFNNDDVVDIALAAPQASQVGITFGTENGFFSGIQAQAFGIFPNGITVGDFNLDHKLDIALTETNALSFSTLTNSLGHRLSQSQVPRTFTSLKEPFAGDLDGNGSNDLIILDNLGNLLFRKGYLDKGKLSYLPALVVNLAEPSRDFTVFQTPWGNQVATLGFSGLVTVFSWNRSVEAFRKYTSFPTNQPKGILPGQKFQPGSIYSTRTLDNSTEDLVLVDTEGGLFGVVHPLFDALKREMNFSDGVFRIFDSGLTPLYFQNLDPSRGDSRFALLNSDSGSLSVFNGDAGNTPSGTIVTSTKFVSDPLGILNINQRQISRSQSSFGPFAFTNGNSDTGSGYFIFNQSLKRLEFYQIDELGQLKFDQKISLSLPGLVRDIQIFRYPGSSTENLAVLSADSGYIYIYNDIPQLNQKSVPLAINLNGTYDHFTFSGFEKTGNLIISNSFGDAVFYHFNKNLNQFVIDQTRFSEMASFAVKDTNNNILAFVADQKNNAVYVYKKIGNQISDKYLIETDRAQLSGPIDMKLVYSPGDPNPFLLVANSLGNSISVFQLTDNRVFRFQYLLQVGSNPVSMTVGDLNSDSIPDIVVCNKGSNDISVFVGKGKGTEWIPDSFQRLKSGGYAPFSVEIKQTNTSHGPDLKITNSDGTLALIPGIGSQGNGSGFFLNDPSRISEITTGLGILPTITFATPQLDFYLGVTGNIFVFDRLGLKNFISTEARTFTFSQGYLITGSSDGSIDILSADGRQVKAFPNILDGEIDSLNVLEDQGTFDLFATVKGNSLPFLQNLSQLLLDQPVVIPDRPVELNTSNLVSASLVLVGTVSLSSTIAIKQDESQSGETEALKMDAEGVNQPAEEGADSTDKEAEQEETGDSSKERELLPGFNPEIQKELESHFNRDIPVSPEILEPIPASVDLTVGVNSPIIVSLFYQWDQNWYFDPPPFAESCNSPEGVVDWDCGFPTLVPSFQKDSDAQFFFCSYGFLWLLQENRYLKTKGIESTYPFRKGKKTCSI